MRMTTQVLKNYLQLPQDTKIRDVSIDHNTDIVHLIVEDGDWLPEVLEGLEVPCVAVAVCNHSWKGSFCAKPEYHEDHHQSCGGTTWHNHDSQEKGQG